MLRNFFTKLSRKIEGLYSARLMFSLLLAALLFFWLFNFSAASFSNPSLVKISGHEGLLDLMFYYSAQEAFSILGRYGAAGRELYLKFLAADFIFIPVYSLGFALLFTRVIRTRFGRQSRWLWLNLLPIGIAVFDALENIAILVMLLIYPGATLAIGALSGFATLCKSVLTLISILSLGYLGIGLLISRFKTSHHKNRSDR